MDNRAFVSNHGKDHAQYDANDGGQIRINDQIMSTIAGDLVTTNASTGTSINYAGQSQLIADGKLVPWGSNQALQQPGFATVPDPVRRMQISFSVSFR